MLVLKPIEKDLGEFTVRRTLPARERQRVGPFIFFDHMGPAEFSAGSGVSVRPHPHIGIATITYLFDGVIMHRDSLGYQQAIEPGAVNWMTAGNGIVHSERTPGELLATGSKLHGIQAWLALPLEQEECDPAFEHYPAAAIPEARLKDATVRLIAGEAYGLVSPVRVASRTLYASVQLSAGGSVALPDNYDEIGIYVVDGAIDVAGTTVESGSMLIPEKKRTLVAKRESRLMLLGGDRLEGDRTLWWNFVSSSRDRISEAKRRWKAGEFDAVPGDDEFIPLPE